jgi:saccharopine dehydrogenase-like NADP-dependent oxidoreductase
MFHIPWIDFYLKLLWKLREIRYSKIIMKVVFKKTKKGKKKSIYWYFFKYEEGNILSTIKYEVFLLINIKTNLLVLKD